MSVQIAKEFRWEMGHRLMFHSGGCQNLHGHSYRLRVTLHGTVGDNGMIMDFADLKKIVKPIIKEIDHCMMLHENDTEVIEFIRGHGMKLITLPVHPTAENIALFLGEKIKSELNSHSQVEKITLRLQETATAWAETEVTL
ncbi:MAG: 6-carboxytetrahydropterin synthase [Fimbriimonadaceae bacterium]